jgi:SAM-dependent methyltransferase
VNTPYNKKFYETMAGGSDRSASVVVPLILGLYKIKSVIDVGCGRGFWVNKFAEQGIKDYLGIDGSYINVDDLVIPVEHFRALDLKNDVEINRRFDLACSLEVAEHLPEACAAVFVGSLVKLAPIVLFSAAVPGQGGTHHINEQWQSYWAGHFATHGYRAADCIRPKVYANSSVEWWYQQNILVFSELKNFPDGVLPAASEYELNRVHPQTLTNAVNPRSGRQAIASMFRTANAFGRIAVTKLARK